MPALRSRIGALAGLRAMALAAVCGALLAAAQPPLSWWPTLFLALPPLLWLAEAAPSARAAAWRGWAAGAGYFGAGMFWIVEPFLVEPERYGWMAPVALVAMAGGLALFWAPAFAIARALARPGLRFALALACAWTFADYARGHVLTGFPWALPAYAWIETPVMQADAVFGPYGLGALTLAAGLAVGAGRAGAAAALALVAAGWTWGAVTLARPYPERPDPLVVRLVQPNVPQRLKWRPELQGEFFERHLALTREPPDPAPPGAGPARPPDVVVWPESAVTFLLGEAPALQAEIAAAAGGRPVILGLNRAAPGPEGEEWFNALAVLGPDGAARAVYDKAHLVPFGEYIPLGRTIGRLGGPNIATLTSRGFTPGPGPRLISAPGLPPFRPLVCYEAIFPGAMRAPEGRADWLVQVTNDAWFGALAGPYQHFAQARARAIEQGVPLARAANTGISAMIDGRGRIVALLPLGVEGRIDAALPAALPETIYARLGDLPFLILLASVFGLTVSNLNSGVSRSRR